MNKYKYAKTYEKIMRFLKLAVILAILLLPASFAQDYSEYQSLQLKHIITNSLQITPTDSNYYITSAYIELLWFPREDYRQELEYLNGEPSFEDDNDKLVFEFLRPQAKNLQISVESSVQTSADYRKIFQKVKFPITRINS